MQTLNDLQEILFEVIRPFVPNGLKLSANTDLVADLDLDSMKVMDVVAEVEDAFDISMPLNVLSDVRTIADFARQLQLILKEEK